MSMEVKQAKVIRSLQSNGCSYFRGRYIPLRFSPPTADPMKPTLLCTIVVATLLVKVRAVEKDDGITTSFNTTAPASSDIPNWNTGWPQSETTGWDYIGSVNGPSGVYLGNNWVVTAGHVGPGTFTLAGTSYSVVSGSQINLSNPDSSVADITLFQITSAPSLPALTIASSAPSIGDSVAMIGYGGGAGKTWGLNAVTENNLSVEVTGYSYVTTDFETDYAPPVSDYYLVSGDSGGGDFIYNSSTGNWELAGINEAVDDSHNSYLVQLSAYSSQINAITATPEPTSLVFLGFGVPALLWRSRRGRAFSCAGS